MESRVIHLIDTNRSTPNAIKQVQELLDISAAFNQAVQMPIPTWLPPLVTNHSPIINIDVEECPPSRSSHLSEFLIKSNVAITYISSNLSVPTEELKGLFLSQTFHLPSENIDISTPSLSTYSKEIIKTILGLMTIPFPVDECFWGASRHDGFINPNIFTGENKLEGFILKYLVELRDSNGPSEGQN